MHGDIFKAELQANKLNVLQEKIFVHLSTQGHVAATNGTRPTLCPPYRYIEYEKLFCPSRVCRSLEDDVDRRKYIT